jgi:hypothetical protein
MSLLPDTGSGADGATVTGKLGGRLSAWRRSDFLDSYVRWREACEEVRAAYERAGKAEWPDRGLAFAAFLAALDREEHAARLHATCAGQIRAQHPHALR